MIDESLPVALYQQLAQEFIVKIKSNEWPIDYVIPGELQLSKEYNISRSTVRQALDVLEREGYVIRKQGKGTRITAPKFKQRLVKFYSFSEDVRNMGYTPSSEMIWFKIIPAEERIARTLKIQKGESVFSVKRVRLADNTPLALETSYIPYDLYPFLTEELVVKNGLYNSMRKNIGLQPNQAHETFEAVIIPKAVAKLLRVECPAAGMSLRRITTSGSFVVEYCECIVRGDRYKYEVSLES